MKRFTIVTASLSLFLLLSSCEKFFDVRPDNDIEDEDFYRNREDLNAAAFGMYEALTGEVHKFLLWGDARAAMVTTGQDDPDPYINCLIINTVSGSKQYTANDRKNDVKR